MRKDTRDDLAAMPPVNAKVLLVRGPDHAGVRQLAHADQARIGQWHLTIRVFIEQLKNAWKMIGEKEVQEQVTSSQQPDSNAGVSREKAQFVQDGLAGGKRSIRGKLSPAPRVIRVPSVQGRQQQAGVSDVFHDGPLAVAERCGGCSRWCPAQRR